MPDEQPIAASPRRPGAHRAARPRRRRLLVAGLTLTFAGAGLVGYDQLGTAREAAAAVVDDNTASTELQKSVRRIEESWERGLAPGEVGVLRIPRFDTGGKEFAAPIVQGWDEDDLARGIGQYDGGARPGEAGNVVLAGHRVTHGSPFAPFPSLRVGDLVEIETATRVVTYRLITDGTRYRVPDTTVWPTWSTPDPDLSANRPTKKHYLTLVTCAETFHTDLRNVAIGIEVRARPVQRSTAS
ncbi:class E sortase [Nocardioides marmoriginsengisoli]|uniref:Class E sortase n=1 Tax=Nocardioides marmoriginsengisoli TaxID=661483 RepID=A0A3N0CA87_9ACTN|nr:sortase [Nocardioides marmoriginsengisoli]RNL60370.1 class E sortase [Nocardioides marmoriginsengisoli]